MSATETQPTVRAPIPFRVRAALASGSVLQPLNSSMIAVAIVAIAADFGTSSHISWIISAMYISTSVCAPMAGRLGSIFGARRVFLAGLAMVCIASTAGMFASNVGQLIAVYALIGAGISVHMPTAMTMVRAYAERYARSSRTAMATLVMCGQSIAALGPTVGGLLTGTFGWHSILWVNLPAAALSAAAVLRADVGFAGRSQHTSTWRAVRNLDFAGILLFALTISTAMLFLVSLRSTPLYWLLPITLGALAVFIAREQRATDPFIDVRALARNRALCATLGRTLLTYTCFYCVFFGIPQWLQTVRGMSATEAGLTMLPVAAVGVLATRAGSSTTHRYGARRTLFIGTFALLVSGVLIAVLERSTAPLAVLLIVAAVAGIPNGFNNIGNQSLISAVTTVNDVGAGIGMYRTVAFTGANLAVVVLQLASGGTIDDAGLHRVGWFIAATSIVLLIGLAVSRRMPRSQHTSAPST